MINKTSTDCLMRISKLLPLVMVMACLLSMSLKLSAQEQDNTQSPTKKVTGTVLGADKAPLAGAAVKIKNRTVGTTTDEKGKFSINAAPTDTLVVSYINYTTSYIRVGTKLNIPVLLVEAPTSMNEVIVIGYGSVKRKELTGVVGKVDMEDLRKAPVTSFDQALAGRIAGVVVSSNDGQPGGGSQIVIRGSTAGQDVSPLYVVDGFPIENMDLNSINTNDIETIEVLKDASSIAIYGSRGANGVIIITTKKGKSEPLKVSYAFSEGIQDPTKLMKMLSPYQFVKLQLDLDSMQSTSTTLNVTGHTRYTDTANGIDLNYYKNVNGYNWQKLVLQEGNLQTHNLNILGGNPGCRYALNGAFTDQKGIIINTGLKRYDAKGSLDLRITDNTKFGTSLNYSNTTSYGTIPTSTSTGGVVSNMWEYRPVDILGGAALNLGSIDSSTIGTSGIAPDNLVSPVQEAQNVFRKNTTRTTTFNTYLECALNQDLRFRVTGGINNTFLLSQAFYNQFTSEGTLALNALGTPYNLKGINGSVSNINNNSYITEATLSYRKRFDENNTIDAVFGGSYEYSKTTGNGYAAINVPAGLSTQGINNLSLGNASTASFSASPNKLESILGRVNYSLKQKYIFTVTGREDGSSKFAPGHQWGFFPSAAAAWRFTQENFMRRFTSFLGDSKFRASYGAVGNNKVADFAPLYQNASSNGYAYPINNSYVEGTVPFFPGNPTIQWETTYQLDLGTTLSFFKDRILIDMDYYNKQTRQALLPVPLPLIAGYAGTGSGGYQYQNAGVLRNRGFEFSITTTNIQSVKFTWTSTFNIAFNRNKIMQFYNNRSAIQNAWSLYGGQTAWISEAGHPMSQFYGFKWAGVYQYSDFNELANGTYVLKPGVASYNPSNASVPVQPGDPKYADLNKDGIVDDNDRTVIGNPLPIHTGGLTNNFIYKNFSLNILLQWSYGNQVLNANKLVFENGGYYANSNQFAEEANHWTPNNPTNDIPRPDTRLNGQDPGGETRVSSWLVEDASYLRLKTVSLGYTLPAKLLSRMKISTFRVFIAAQNLLTFTKYSGLDPEVSTYRAANPASSPSGVVGGNALAGVGYLYIQPSSGSSALAQGYDLTPYPRNRTITFGLNVTF